MGFYGLIPNNQFRIVSYAALLSKKAVTAKLYMRSEIALQSVAEVTEIVKASPSDQW